MAKKVFLSTAFLIILCFSSRGQRIVRLENLTLDFPLEGDYLSIYEDKTGKLSIDQVSAPGFNGFKVNEDRFASNKNSTSAYWLKFEVANNSSFDKVYFLETHSPHTNLMEIYVPDRKGGYVVKKGGENFKFGEREFVNKNLIFNLSIPSSDSVSTYYIRILSKNYSSFNFRIRSANYFIYYITNEYYLLGIYYGILLIMALYNLLMYFSVKEQVYLFYVLYVISAIVITMTDDGLGFQYLWNNHPHWARFIGYHFAPMFYMISFIAYSISFLELRGFLIFQRNLLLKVTAVYLAYYLVMNVFSLPVFPILYTIPFIVTYYISWKVFLKGYKAARLFLIGFSVILFSIIILQLRAEHILQGNIFTVYVLNIAQLVDVVIFSYALADKYRINKKEKEQAQSEIIKKLEENKSLQEKVNRELEGKVKERTEELVSKNKELLDANNQLKVLNEKINEMNARLDYDNWYLKKDIKEEIKARVIDAEVTFEQFSEVFPDDTSCLRYLEDLKWKEGFKCRKCGNTKYSNSSGPFNRKCSRCGNIESPTAYTIFHGIKFPINKAFYLTYIVHRKGNTISSDEAAQMLSIGRNTAWKFKKKVLDEVEVYKKKHKDKPLDSWEEIIV